MNLPNQPCECGSGRKQKKCHPLGAPVYGPEREPMKPVERAKRKADSDKAFLMIQTMAVMFGARR